MLRRVTLLLVVIFQLCASSVAMAYSEDMESMSQEVSGAGRLDWPVPTPPAVMTSAFGYRIHPITGDVRHHNGVDLAGDVRCAGTSSTSPPCMILYLKLVRLPSGTACVHHATSMCSCVALSHARKTIERVSVIGTIVRWSPCTCPPPALLRTLGGALRGRARTGPGPATSPRSR